MKTIDSTLQTTIESGTIQIPIAKVNLYKTTFPAASFGVNTVFYRNLTVTGDAFVGTPISGTYTALASDSTYLQPKGQLWEFYGTNRPLGLPSTEDLSVRFEGYFHVPSDVSGGVDFKLIANPSATFYADTGSSIFPADLTATAERIAYSASDNIDALSGGTYQAAWSADSWYGIRLDWLIPKGSYAKCVLLWRPTGETEYRLADSSVINTQASDLTVDDDMDPTSDALRLPGLLGVSGQDETGKASTVSFELAFTEGQAAYSYDSTTDSYGVLRPNRRVDVFTGFNTQGAGSTPATTDYVEMGTYFIDTVHLERQDRMDVLRVTARDTRKKAAETLNLLYPNILSYDLAGYDSDAVFLDPDGRTRYVAYDSWTLAKTVRDLLTQAGFTAEQVWATDANSADKIQENSVYLDRGSTYRLKLPQEIKDEDLHYSFDPGARLLDLVNELAEKYGYEWGVDYQGHAYFREANNPTQYAASDASIDNTGSWSGTEYIKGLGGTYSELTGAGTLTITTATCEGFNLIFHRQTTTEEISVSVDASPVTGWQSYSLEYDKEWFYRNGDDPDVGYNPTVLEIGRGLSAAAHTIVVTCDTGTRFGGYEIFTQDRETADLTINKNRVLRLDVENTDANIRNDVIVAGADKGIDMDKLVYARSVDVKSISNPVAKNYVGERKPLILPDPAIRREDVARYTSLAVLKRYRTLADAVSYEIPAHPHLELGDTLTISDETSGLAGSTFWLNQLSWSVSMDRFLMTCRLDPYQPYPSYSPILEPTDPTANVSDFTFSRTDGESIDPDDYTSNFSMAYPTSAGTGYYNGLFAQENPPVFIKIEFDLWKSSTCTLTIKDHLTGRAMAILAQDEYLEWGHHEFYWDGKWYDEDHSSYSLAPYPPGWDSKQWSDYIHKTDPITGEDLGNEDNGSGAGYFFVELVYRPEDDPDERSVTEAANTTDDTKNFGKLILAPSNTPNIYQLAHTTHGVSGVPFGGRYDVYDDEYAPDAPSGIRLKLNTYDQPYKLKFSGWIDAHVLITANTTLTTGDTYLSYSQAITPESFGTGYHLYRITDEGSSPWGSELVAGETDFLATGTYTFMIDPTGMPLIAEGSGGSTLYDDDGRLRPRSLSNKALFDRVIPYRNGYLDYFAAAYPDQNVNAAFYARFIVEAVNKAGQTIKQIQTDIVRLEDSDYASNKHCVFPDGPGIPASDDGDYANTRGHTAGGERKVHFTCNNASVNYRYD